MKIAVFATGWNGEYLRDMYHGLENSQKEFHDSIHLYASFGRLGSGDSFNKSEFDFFELQIWRRTMDFCIRVPRSKKEMSSSGYSNGS